MPMQQDVINKISSALHDIAYGICRKGTLGAEPSVASSLAAIATSLKSIEQKLDKQNAILTQMNNNYVATNQQKG